MELVFPEGAEEFLALESSETGAWAPLTQRPILDEFDQTVGYENPEAAWGGRDRRLFTTSKDTILVGKYRYSIDEAGVISRVQR